MTNDVLQICLHLSLDLLWSADCPLRPTSSSLTPTDCQGSKPKTVLCNLYDLYGVLLLGDCLFLRRSSSPSVSGICLPRRCFSNDHSKIDRTSHTAHLITDGNPKSQSLLTLSDRFGFSIFIYFQGETEPSDNAPRVVTGIEKSSQHIPSTFRRSVRRKPLIHVQLPLLEPKV